MTLKIIFSFVFNLYFVFLYTNKLNLFIAMAGLPNLPDWLTSRPYLTGDFVKSLDLPPPVCIVILNFELFVLINCL